MQRMLEDRFVVVSGVVAEGPPKTSGSKQPAWGPSAATLPPLCWCCQCHHRCLRDVREVAAARFGLVVDVALFEVTSEGQDATLTIERCVTACQAFHMPCCQLPCNNPHLVSPVPNGCPHAKTKTMPSVTTHHWLGLPAGLGRCQQHPGSAFPRTHRQQIRPQPPEPALLRFC